jgi:hypothetical protein
MLTTPLQWLCEVAGYWRELEQAVIHINPEHPKYTQWVTVNGVLEAKSGAGEQSIMNRHTFIIVPKTRALHKSNALKKINIKVKCVNEHHIT